MNNKRTRYRVTIENESRLEKVSSLSASLPAWVSIGVACAGLAFVLAGLLIALTPARNLLPGYLKEGERASTQINLMVLDSLKQVSDRNSAFVGNILSVLNPQTETRDTALLNQTSPALSTDSLLKPSVDEQKFVSMMREREKYSIAVAAPSAAQSLMFAPLSDRQVFTSKSRTETRGEVVVAKGSPINSIGDGTVITVSQSMRDGGSYVIVQHPKGFLSRIGRLGTVLVEPGDAVNAGQIIALTNRASARRAETVSIEMWYNGNKLIPFEYIGTREEPKMNNLKIRERQ